MKATHLTLVCHALTQSQKAGRLPAPSDLLVQSAWQAFETQPDTHVITAPEQRARETASRFGNARVAPLLADCDLGDWQGMPLKQLQAEQPQALADWLQDPASTVHGGESFAALCQRMAAWLVTFDRPGAWLAVTHPWVIRAVLVQVLGCPLSAAQRIDILPLSRLQLACTGQWRLRVS